MTRKRAPMKVLLLAIPIVGLVNLLTLDATDPKSGTAEFKATAIRIEKLPQAVATG